MRFALKYSLLDVCCCLAPKSYRFVLAIFAETVDWMQLNGCITIKLIDYFLRLFIQLLIPL